MIICFLKVKGEIIQECYCNFIDSVFGEDLSEEIGKSNTETPWVISKCTEEIENWLKNNRKCLYIMN